MTACVVEWSEIFQILSIDVSTFENQKVYDRYYVRHGSCTHQGGLAAFVPPVDVLSFALHQSHDTAQWSVRLNCAVKVGIDDMLVRKVYAVVHTLMDWFSKGGLLSIQLRNSAFAFVVFLEQKSQTVRTTIGGMGDVD